MKVLYQSKDPNNPGGIRVYPTPEDRERAVKIFRRKGFNYFQLNDMSYGFELVYGLFKNPNAMIVEHNPTKGGFEDDENFPHFVAPQYSEADDTRQSGTELHQ